MGPVYPDTNMGPVYPDTRWVLSIQLPCFLVKVVVFFRAPEVSSTGDPTACHLFQQQFPQMLFVLASFCAGY